MQNDVSRRARLMTESDPILSKLLPMHAALARLPCACGPAGARDLPYVALQERGAVEAGSPDVRRIRRFPMTAATFHAPTGYPEARPAPKRSFFLRFFDAMAEARMRQAVSELARHRALVPEDLL